MPAIIHRDTITGRIVTAAHAKANQHTTTREVRRASELRRPLAKAEATIAELSDLVEVEYAGRMRLAERVRAVRKLHHEVDVPALGPDCSAGECDHENDCPSVPTPVCDHCHAIGESASPYPFEDAPGLTEVLWPCKTIRILDGDTGGDHDDANSNSKPPLGVGLEPIAFDPPLTDDEAGAFLDAITTDEADQ